MAKEKKTKKKEKKIIRKGTPLKKKKRRWVTILAPKNFGGKELGESLASDVQELKNRKIKVSLSDLGKGRNSSIKVIFNVKESADGKGVTEAYGYYLLPSLARRIARKGRTKVFKALKLKTKDNVDSVLKIVLVTRGKVTSGISRNMSKELDSILLDEIKKNSFEVNLSSIIDYKFQKRIRELVKRVHPVSSLEVLMFRKIG